MKTKIQGDHPVFFAPHLTLIHVLPAMEFYKKAFGAIELRRWTNPDGSVHVAELEIEGALFHLHEETPTSKELSPTTLKGTTSRIGIFVPDPHSFVRRAVEAGGQETSKVKDYEYGYRQGVVTDPFGHQWLIQKKI
jgi:PhnB protein